MEEMFDKILAPYMSSLPEFTIAVMGIVGTLAFFAPEDSTLSRLLNKVTGRLSKLKDYLLKKLKK
tara:strand:+ start:4378 stop:4572 length:195 start_codon:yes stop_codon:yes gene_type:complete